MKVVTRKLGNMRKPQEFVVYPSNPAYDNGLIKVQSDKSIGIFDPKTGKGILNTKSQYIVQNGIPFTFPMDFVNECVAIQLKSGDHIGGNIFVA